MFLQKAVLEAVSDKTGTKTAFFVEKAVLGAVLGAGSEKTGPKTAFFYFKTAPKTGRCWCEEFPVTWAYFGHLFRIVSPLESRYCLEVALA